jgi:hypothetical protein
MLCRARAEGSEVGVAFFDTRRIEFGAGDKASLEKKKK